MPLSLAAKGAVLCTEPMDHNTKQSLVAGNVLSGILANPNVNPLNLEEKDWQRLVGDAVTAAADLCATVDKG
jgi:hypothetical protein